MPHAKTATARVASKPGLVVEHTLAMIVSIIVLSGIVVSVINPG